MREFMDHVVASFHAATGWKRDNSYPELNATANELLDFRLPLGLRLSLSSLATPHFATGYQLGSVGVVDGSLAYLYSSVPLKDVVARSDQIPLPALLRSYRQIDDLDLRSPIAPSTPTSTTNSSTRAVIADREHGAAARVAVNGKDGEEIRVHGSRNGTLLYGRLYLPQSVLEASVIRRLAPAVQVRMSAVSSAALRDGGTILAAAQVDTGRYGVEGLASTDGGLLGLRGLYNFGDDAMPPLPGAVTAGTTDDGGNVEKERERERIYGRFSAGGELYYGVLNKSGGMSLGARFATLPAHRGTPLTATLTANPLMGTISATYAVQAREYCSLATRLDFNVHSYESDWKIGMELWSKRRPGGFLLGAEPGAALAAGQGALGEGIGAPRKWRERSFQAKMEWRLDDPEPTVNLPPTEGASEQGEYLGVLKARMDQQLRVGLLWEGRIKSLIFSLGSGIDLRKLDRPFGNVGLEVQYSS